MDNYMNRLAMTDIALAEYIGEFIKHHRLNQNKTQNDLAKETMISRSTIQLLERGKNISLYILIKVLRNLDQLHFMDAFEIEDDISPIERTNLIKKNKRQRARNSTISNFQSGSTW